MKFEFDADKFAKDLIMKRRVDNRFEMRQVAGEAGVSAATIHRAETKETLSLESFTKICSWLQIEPGSYFKKETT